MVADNLVTYGLVEPNEKGKGFVFENGIVGGVIPKEYINPVADGIEEAMKNEILLGYPVEDIKVKLLVRRFISRC